MTEKEQAAQRRAARIAAGDLCSEQGCPNPRATRGLCKTHYNRAGGYSGPGSCRDMEKRRASWRAKNRRRRAGRRITDLSSAAELEMRRKAKRCPYVKEDGSVCGVKLTDEPFLPNSKELDREVTGYIGGTYTVGNVRIICRECNGRRPKDGSDFVGQPTLWALDPGAVATAGSLRARRNWCEHGVASSRRCYDCKPPMVPRRRADGRRAAELRAEGWAWKDIAAETRFNVTSVVGFARKYGDPDVVARWHEHDVECRQCGAVLPVQVGKGRPRKYCERCRPSSIG